MPLLSTLLRMIITFQVQNSQEIDKAKETRKGKKSRIRKGKNKKSRIRREKKERRLGFRDSGKNKKKTIEGN